MNTIKKQISGLLLAASAAGVWAQDYPNRPVRILVPNAPGSSVDTMTRILSTKLGEALGNDPEARPALERSAELLRGLIRDGKYVEIAKDTLKQVEERLAKLKR